MTTPDTPQPDTDLSISLPEISKRGFALFGQWQTVPDLPSALYLVSTPIGNLGDITLRALQTLAGADLILCEDTRTSAKLLNHFGIKGRRGALHDHNERQKAPLLVKDIQNGMSIALISDAGTPLLSDPGYPLVRQIRAAGLDVFAIPGASALLAGLAIAGLPTDKFSFLGFLPPKSAARQKALDTYGERTDTLVFYESPRRLAKCLADMASIFGEDREAVVTLELTKKFERSFSGTVSELAVKMGEADQRGEAVILVAGASQNEQKDEGEWRGALQELLKTQPLKTAVAEITESYGLKRKQVYNEALALKK